MRHDDPGRESPIGPTDDKREPRGRVALRGLAGASIAVALVATAAVASRAPRLRVDPDTFAIQLWLVPIGKVLLVSLGVAAFAVALLSAASRRDSDDGDDGSRRRVWLLALLLVALVGVIALFGNAPPASNEQEVAPPGQVDLPTDARERAVRTSPPTPVVVAGALLAVTAGVAFVLRRRTEDEDLADPASPDEEAVAVIARSRRPLTEIVDPRAGIIAAYEVMEDAFGEAGHRRTAAETPGDFLARVLSATSAPPQPVRRLTDLFEVARFSDHPVSEDMRRNALALLDAIERSLQVPA